jgi:tyrosyl-tRNA synthetase
MLLQAYDFLRLFDGYGCKLQMGGSDQWGNIVAGIDLIRRMRQETAFGITFPLITTNSGEKMGKTAKGAIWLDPIRTTPYDYYQYWINTDDRDVVRFLALFTFLPIDEIKSVEALTGSDQNAVKTVLAFETTQLAHGEENAIKAHKAAEAMFGGRNVSQEILPSSSVPREAFDQDDVSVPRSHIPLSKLEEGVPAFKIFHMTGLAQSGGDARRLIQQGGAYLNGKRIESVDTLITGRDVHNMEIVLRSGKKRFHKIKIEP